MNIKSTLENLIASVLLAAAVVVPVIPVFAQTSIGTGVGVGVQTPLGSADTNVQAQGAVKDSRKRGNTAADVRHGASHSATTTGSAIDTSMEGNVTNTGAPSRVGAGVSGQASGVGPSGGSSLNLGGGAGASAASGASGSGIGAGVSGGAGAR